MTAKQRILSTLKGKETDRLPWSPFLAYWWDAQPKALQDKGQLMFLKKIGADPLLRGSHVLHKEIFNKTEIRESKKNNLRCIEYDTPAGKLTECHTYVKEANTWFLTEHPVKNPEDLKILSFIYENMEIVPALDCYLEDFSALGEDGLYVPILGTERKTCFQGLVEHWVGTEELVYALNDTPGLVEECLEIMRRRSMEAVKIAVGSKAEAYTFWEDSSTTNISPDYFEKYTAPEISNWAKIVHDAGGLLIHHACGHVKDLLPLMAQTGIDAIESIPPPPTGDIEVWDAAEALPDNIAIIGGIEPTMLLNLSLPELQEYTETLIRKMKGYRFILANSDSCPPGVSVEKFELIGSIR